MFDITSQVISLIDGSDLALSLLHEQLMFLRNVFLHISGNGSQYNNILMTLRKAANHPLLLRSLYTDETLLKMAKKYCKVLTDYFIWLSGFVSLLTY